jgi:hypothetical protein
LLSASNDARRGAGRMAPGVGMVGAAGA